MLYIIKLILRNYLHSITLFFLTVSFYAENRLIYYVERKDFYSISIQIDHYTINSLLCIELVIQPRKRPWRISWRMFHVITAVLNFWRKSRLYVAAVVRNKGNIDVCINIFLQIAQNQQQKQKQKLPIVVCKCLML